MNSPTRSTNADSLASGVLTLLQFAGVVWRRKIVVLVAIAVCVVLGSLYYAATPRLYKAQASLLIIPTGNDLWNGSATLDRSHQALMPTYEQLFYEDVVLDGAVSRLENQPRLAADFDNLPTARWAAILRDRLSAQRQRRTNLIQVGYRSRRPAVAEIVVSAVVASYLDFIDRNHRDVAAEIVQILDKERLAIEQRLQQKQTELVTLNRRVRDLGLSERSEAVHPVVRRVLRLNDQLIEAQQQRLDLQATLATLHQAVQDGGDLRQYLASVEPMVGRELLMGVLGLNPEAAETLGQVEQRLFADRARLDKLRQYYGPRYPEVVELVAAIQRAEQYTAQYQQHVADRMNRLGSPQIRTLLVSMLEQKLVKIQTVEQQLGEQYTVCEADAIRLNDEMTEAALVKNEVLRLQALHDALMNRIAGIDISQQRADVRVTVVSDPVAGGSPVWPQLPLIAAGCFLGGLGLGIGTVYVLDLLDDRFRSPEEIQQQLGAPVLALIHDLPSLPNDGVVRPHVASLPDSPESEAFRTLRTALRFSQEEADCLAVTSTEPGDGKTTILANLGAAHAQAGKRTLLIDADLRRPGLSRLFELRGVHGLSHILAADESVTGLAEDAVIHTAVERLDVLPSGPRPADPAELLGSSRFAELLAWAAAAYDQVLVDCPPMMAASDGAIIARQTDGAVVVIQPEKNHRRLVLRAVARLRAMQAPIVGVAANRINDEPGTAYYGLAGGYGYNYHDDQDADHDMASPIQQDHSEVGLEADSVPVRRRAA